MQTRPLSGVEVPLSDTPRGKRLRELSIGSSSLLTSVTVDKENTSVQPQPDSCSKPVLISNLLIPKGRAPPSTPISPDQRPIQSLCHAGNAPLNKPKGSELKATDFRLVVTFPSSSRSNFEVWDQENENYYSVQYTGAKMRNAGKKVDLDPTSGIVVDTVWLRTSTAGVAKRTSSSHVEQCGWGIQFFVPIATGLFDRRETRVFQVEGCLRVKGEQLGPEIATISVSHLLRGTGD
ncbi:hypothetical protein B0H14DRAFT_2816722, partial [Mycena olivaceomarginata]